MSRSKVRSPRYTVEIRRRAAEMVLLEKRPVAQVARQLNCSPQSITNWIGHFRDQILSTTSSIVPNQYSTSIKSPKSRTAFLPLQVDEELPTSTDARIELVTKNGLTLRFPVDTSPDSLVAIVRSLEAVPC